MELDKTMDIGFSNLFYNIYFLSLVFLSFFPFLFYNISKYFQTMDEVHFCQWAQKL